MKAYCINLDRRPDRLAHMTAEFARAGIPFERIAAVDGQDPEVAAAAARLPLSSESHGMSGGAYGCLLSHRIFWQTLITSKDPWGMVFEDDLLLVPGMDTLLLGNGLPEDADIIKLEVYGFQRIYVSAKKHDIGDGRCLARLCSAHLGTGGYILSALAAKKLLAVTEATGDPVDLVLFGEKSAFFQAAIIYQMMPAPVLQGDRSKAAGVHPALGWQSTSITERHVWVNGIAPAEMKLETRWQRVWRRICSEIRSRWRGQRYVVVSHG